MWILNSILFCCLFFLFFLLAYFVCNFLHVVNLLCFMIFVINWVVAFTVKCLGWLLASNYMLGDDLKYYNILSVFVILFLIGIWFVITQNFGETRVTNSKHCNIYIKKMCISFSNDWATFVMFCCINSDTGPIYHSIVTQKIIKCSMCKCGVKYFLLNIEHILNI